MTATVTRQEFIKELRSWEGVPFRHQGRSRLGTDCLGLPISIARVMDLLPEGFYDPVHYGRAPNDGALIAAVQKYCVPIKSIEDAALVTFCWPGTSQPSHLALLEGRYMIHAYERVAKVVRHGYGQPWKRLTHSIYRIPGVVP